MTESDNTSALFLSPHLQSIYIITKGFGLGNEQFNTVNPMCGNPRGYTEMMTLFGASASGLQEPGCTRMLQQKEDFHKPFFTQMQLSQNY